MNVLIDGCGLPAPENSQECGFWMNVLPRLSGTLPEAVVYYLSRGPAVVFPVDGHLKVLSAPLLDPNQFPVEQQRLAALCRELNIQAFASSRFSDPGTQCPFAFVLPHEYPFLPPIDANSLLVREREILTARIRITWTEAGADYLVGGYQVPRESVRVLRQEGETVDWEVITKRFAGAMVEVAAL